MSLTLRTLLAAIALMTSTSASAFGLSYAVSLEKAKEISKADSSKHILVFYTEGW